MWRNPPEILFYKMIRVVVFLCMAILPFARCSKIHEHMTREEMMSVFQAGHEFVPEYEVVPVLHSVHKRSPEAKQEVHLKAFGKAYSLLLKPNIGLLSGKQVGMWSVERNASQPDGLNYERIPDEDIDIGDVYHDTENMASILLHRDVSGKMLVEGNIGHDLVIKPLPDRVTREVVSELKELQEPHLLPNLTRIKRGLDGFDLDQTHHHVVYRKTARPADDEYSDFAYMEPDHLSKRFRSKRSVSDRSKREAPYVIYPEILCIVDYDGYRLHGGDNVQIKRYFVSFWNGVDLRYKLLKGPKIRISIAGIIISRGRDATPYLERNRVGRDAIDSAAALTDMGKYLFRERRLPVYDIAVAVTKYDMCRRRKGGRCTKGTAGFAYVGGACVVNKRLEKVNSVAIIEDTGGFSGIIVAAHEVGHLLGAVHDGSPPPSYLGGPGAEKCRWEDGYIMSDLRHTEKGFKWSHCSVSSFHHFLNGDTATCLYNAPHEDEALPRVLPGKLLSLDAQCRKDRGTSACFKDDRVCAQLFCFDAGSGYCVAYRPAAEGSPCGDGQYCINGKCVAEHENIIPDYTQNVPTYVRRENLYTRYNTSTTEYRYPWDGTTRSTYHSPYKYTTSYPQYGSSSDSIISGGGGGEAGYPTTSPSPPATAPPYTTGPPPTQYYYSHYYGPSTLGNLITDEHHYKKYNYGYNNDYQNHGTTRRTPAPAQYEYPSSQGAYVHGGGVDGNDDGPNAWGYTKSSSPSPPPPSAYRGYAKSTVRSTSHFSVTTSGGAQYAPHAYAHETEAGECQDVGTDCAELIDRLMTWLCHLKSVRSRCCASLKSIC